MVCNIRVVNKITNHEYDYNNIRSHDDDNNGTIKNDDTLSIFKNDSPYNPSVLGLKCKSKYSDKNNNTIII